MRARWKEGRKLSSLGNKKGRKAEGQLGSDLNTDVAPVDKWLEFRVCPLQVKGLTALKTPVQLYRGAFHWRQVSRQQAAHFLALSALSQLPSFQTSDTDSSHACLSAQQPRQRPLSCLLLERQLPHEASARASQEHLTWVHYTARSLCL